MKDFHGHLLDPQQLKWKMDRGISISTGPFFPSQSPSNKLSLLSLFKPHEVESVLSTWHENMVEGDVATHPSTMILLGLLRAEDEPMGLERMEESAQSVWDWRPSDFESHVAGMLWMEKWERKDKVAKEAKERMTELKRKVQEVERDPKRLKKMMEDMALREAKNMNKGEKEISDTLPSTPETAPGSPDTEPDTSGTQETQ